MTDATTAPPVPLEDQLCFSIYSAEIAIQRAYKPLLDGLGLTYPQYLVLNVLWREDAQTVGGIAQQLALESSTLTPLLKRMEAAGLVRRTRNPENERQVIIALTSEGDSLRFRARCLNDNLLLASGQTPGQLAELNRLVRQLRDAIYSHTGVPELAAPEPVAAPAN
ncbi:DNA-binding transcriptional regulator, MarR family [Bosea sp. CRIB-10]|uniref:MarR family winged helix-turn-helix transcriptional regulator n=1 Tax=Bosea sp. CRIB-10 TaxID=378404 RepID=UPI0008F0A378|nr:MarR family transcriptional regulator [Bosea sp. CRIB-10]SFB73133.1 DNA-binding transcriptional regulator, MarR family [Bosea sp. CRIB-10]